MNDKIGNSPRQPCSNCGALQPTSHTYCDNCGARLTPVEFNRLPRVSFFSLLMTLPLISILAMGSCAATLAIGAGAVMLNWKIVASGIGALLLFWLIARLTNQN